ncbi:protein of unknown function [Candidatus Hydrogenisulfobacillus filiaventi]|uniref:Uncharacterized protein n=1 Tax=Candidatus Hydrogenisulfobacillus filiaventi TaxID=2707344 RepID=A0A6F8ZHB6_9FIRM|nr:hypothetical protein [Bacillota bacterium]CAB1129069.1 protein of unknown function [Candidatus Hydrogenisulfobacillus filiaventi]
MSTPAAPPTGRRAGGHAHARRLRPLRWLFAGIVILIAVLFWDLNALVAGLRHTAGALARLEGARRLLGTTAAVAWAHLLQLVHRIGHWLASVGGPA